MIRKVTVTAALMAVGMMTSLGYTAVAQTSRPADRNPTDRPANRPNRPAYQTNPTDQPGTRPNRPADQTNPTPGTRPNDSRESATDRDFMIQAAQMNRAEIELSQVALRKAASPEVKQYARQIIADHRQAGVRLSELAREKGITLPTQPDAEHQALKARLQEMSGRAFDQAYMTAMVADHEEAVRQFQNQATQGRDPDLKAFAANILPRIQEHWTMARSMTGNPGARNQHSPNSPR
ncbi:MAG TPA: DUF4142 domain-containing protein [Oculatellaceae cyanobacterium]